MHAPALKRFVSWLIGMPRPAAATGSRAKSASAATVLDFDPFWHGDHWQNLLASPMDARHYVMEDWAVPVDGDEFNYRGGGEKQDGRRRRRG